ncbi:hypothetical protein FRC09_013529 [Ceratobasidium sp. 395]|nr:hypothetical protein FRC09_013529 [Ceratobasidium sp. 395]
MEFALDEWKSTRVQLSEVVKAYISACNNLGTICARDHQTRSRTLAEQAFIQLDTELEALATEEDALRTARFSLLTLRNKSGTLTPINMLPPEILVQIFALSGSNCKHHRRSPPHNLSNTCVYWRQIVLDTPYFWTHIDIGPGIPWQLSKLALERAKTNPLHLHIQGDNILNWNVTVRDVHSRASSLQMELQPFMHGVHSLELSSNNDAGGLLPHLVKLWLSYGDKELAKSLSMYQHIRDETLLDESSEDLTQTSISTRNEVSLSLQTLQLHGARFKWDSSAYHGLVDLQLGFESKSQIGTISALELVQIFLASSMLAILKLEGLLVTPTADLGQTVPIPLHHMRVLNLTGMTSSAELKVGLAVSDEYEEELRGFFNYFDAWSAILEPINTLRTLI